MERKTISAILCWSETFSEVSFRQQEGFSRDMNAVRRFLTCSGIASQLRCIDCTAVGSPQWPARGGTIKIRLNEPGAELAGSSQVLALVENRASIKESRGEKGT